MVVFNYYEWLSYAHKLHYPTVIFECDCPQPSTRLLFPVSVIRPGISASFVFMKCWELCFNLNTTHCGWHTFHLPFSLQKLQSSLTRWNPVKELESGIVCLQIEYLRNDSTFSTLSYWWCQRNVHNFYLNTFLGVSFRQLFTNEHFIHDHEIYFHWNEMDWVVMEVLCQ